MTTLTSTSCSMPSPRSPASYDNDNPEEIIYANCRIEDLPCYHDSVTRNTAEVLLLNNAEEGSFLIRPSTNKEHYVVSVRLANSVKHFQMYYNEQWYTFGNAQFWSPLEIWIHLQTSPVLECDEGVVAHLKYPYMNEEKESLPKSHYSVITRHYVPARQPRVRKSSSNIVMSKEGQLYKKKQGKRWKRRWFILNKNILTYKKNEKERKVLKKLDLSMALQVEEYDESNRDNCFRIIFPIDSYILSAETHEDKNNWMEVIKWQMNASHEHRPGTI